LISRIKVYYDNMTLFKKMVLPSIIVLILALSYVIFTFYESKLVASQNNFLQNKLVPMLEKTLENKIWLNQMAENFAFSASFEVDGLENADKHAQDIEKNLIWIEKNSQYILSDANKTLQKFNYYYTHTKDMIEAMINNKDSYFSNEKQLNNVFESFKEVEVSFDVMHKIVKLKVEEESSKIDKRMNFILTNGFVGITLLICFLITMAFLIYFNIRGSFIKLLNELTSINDEKTDIKKRLLKFSNDEFGVLSEKLNKVFASYESKYNKLDEEKSKVLEMAKRDKLTNLYNRHHGEDILKKLIDSNIKYSLILMDIDNFKNVNDTYGHLVGDKVLKNVASEINTISRKDDVVCRWGGEEFLIILTNVTKIQLELKAEKYRMTIENIKFDELNKVTASFGLSQSNSILSSEEVIKKADNALYKAKRIGKNCVLFEA